MNLSFIAKLSSKCLVQQSNLANSFIYLFTVIVAIDNIAIMCYLSRWEMRYAGRTVWRTLMSATCRWLRAVNKDLSSSSYVVLVVRIEPYRSWYRPNVACCNTIYRMIIVKIFLIIIYLPKV